jgi:hypothetical protein
VGFAKKIGLDAWEIASKIVACVEMCKKIGHHAWKIATSTCFRFWHVKKIGHQWKKVAPKLGPGWWSVQKVVCLPYNLHWNLIAIFFSKVGVARFFFGWKQKMFRNSGIAKWHRNRAIFFNFFDQFFSILNLSFPIFYNFPFRQGEQPKSSEPQSKTHAVLHDGYIFNVNWI